MNSEQLSKKKRRKRARVHQKEGAMCAHGTARSDKLARSHIPTHNDAIKPEYPTVCIYISQFWCADEITCEPRKRSNAHLSSEAQPDERDPEPGSPEGDGAVRESDANVELPSTAVVKATGEGILSKSTFASLEISEKLLRAVKDMGHEYLTHIQDAAIGPLLKGNDVLGAARTGVQVHLSAHHSHIHPQAARLDIQAPGTRHSSATSP